MAETKTTETTPKKKGFFKGLKAEFGRIIWPDKDTVWKESAAVLAVSVILALDVYKRQVRSCYGYISS